ncbi:MAG: lipopolysaccharide transport periplasmic protein LptA [Proteobacteria bacterium]|nr:lipopolysaccharide transport periplasmic protein LptA [Pseudomonadota bacterium]
MKTATIVIAGCATLLLAGQAFALKTDKEQPANVDANYSKESQSKSGVASDPDIVDLDGNVVITRGSIKMNSAHATAYRIPSSAKDANAGQMSRFVLTGKQAHMQQLHDGDCALMTATADKIDYNPLTNLAELTGGVVVVQQGRGEFHGEHMLYNTDTGDMESGSPSESSGRVHMVMEAKTRAPATSASNCGFGAGTAKPVSAKPAEKTPANAKPDGAH